MPQVIERVFTSEDYWGLPDGERAELIGGKLYAMAPPNRIHQKLLNEMCTVLTNYVKKNRGECQVYPAPFAVDLGADDREWVEPDISVICDRTKLTERGCTGAPDFIIEITSPSSRKMDYSTKNALYVSAGVREYWIVDPVKERTTVYRYEEDVAPVIVPFSQDLAVGIYGDLSMRVADFMEETGI